MEADSTTFDNFSKPAVEEECLPFSPCPRNLKLYKDLIGCKPLPVPKKLEHQIVENMQQFGLIPQSMICPIGKPECNVVVKPARVVDRVQWVCEGCGKRQPIRQNTFFLRLNCSLLQALQITLAWCEDADIDVSAQHFGVKPKVASQIFDRLDELATKEHNKMLLGGAGSVVLAEIYPDCLNRLSPDTTDQLYMHRILMLADTNHIPTHYKLHVIRGDPKKAAGAMSVDNQILQAEIDKVISNSTVPNSMVVTGNNVPQINGSSTIQQLVQYCDADMQHFLTSRIWRQALSLCAASRDLCGARGRIAQLYLDAALYRLTHSDGFYHQILTLLAHEHTKPTAIKLPKLVPILTNEMSNAKAKDESIEEVKIEPVVVKIENEVESPQTEIKMEMVEVKVQIVPEQIAEAQEITQNVETENVVVVHVKKEEICQEPTVTDTMCKVEEETNNVDFETHEFVDTVTLKENKSDLEVIGETTSENNLFIPNVSNKPEISSKDTDIVMENDNIDDDSMGVVETEIDSSSMDYTETPTVIFDPTLEFRESRMDYTSDINRESLYKINTVSRDRRESVKIGKTRPQFDEFGADEDELDDYSNMECNKNSKSLIYKQYFVL